MVSTKSEGEDLMVEGSGGADGMCSDGINLTMLVFVLNPFFSGIYPGQPFLLAFYLLLLPKQNTNKQNPGRFTCG